MGAFDPLTEKQSIIINLPENYENHYRCIIKAISDDRLVASAPSSIDDVKLDVSPGTIVNITYIDKVAVYTFSSPVLACTVNPLIMTLGKPVGYKRIQRRNFVRLNTRLKVISNVLDDKLNAIGQTFSAKTMDISGGGLLFGCDVLVKIDQVLEATIFLNDDEYVRAIGKVIRVIENSASSKDRYSVGFEYTKIKETDRDKIIKYILNQQRLLRVKGLL